MHKVADEEEGGCRSDENSSDNDAGRGMVRDQPYDPFAIECGQDSQGDKAHRPTDGDSREELLPWILHCSRGEHKRNHGRWRRKYRGDGDGTEAPFLEGAIDLRQSALGDALAQGLLPFSKSDLVSDIRSYHGSHDRHCRVVGPETRLIRA